MARTDWEAAYTELQAWVAETKPGYGQQELLAKMAELAHVHKVPEDLLQRAARLYGGPAFREAIQTAETDPALVPAAPGREGQPPPPTDDRGGHSGRINGHQGPD